MSRIVDEIFWNWVKMLHFGKFVRNKVDRFILKLNPMYAGLKYNP
jgi:hypothetical protein